MPKIVKSAMGEVVDWDLLRVKAAMDNNITTPVVINNREIEVGDKRDQRTRVENARRVMTQLTAMAKTQMPLAPPKPDLTDTLIKADIKLANSVGDDNGWTD